MFSNRCFYDQIGSLKNVAYLMINTFRLNNNTAIYEGLKLQKSGTKFDCFMYHIPEEDFQDKFFLNGIENRESIRLLNITYESNFQRILSSLSSYDTVFMDQPYLKEEIELAKKVKEVNPNIVFMEHNVSVPVRVTSNKEEYSARTIRPKVWKEVTNYRMNYPKIEQMFTYERKALEEFSDFVDNTLRDYDKRNDPANDYQSHMSKYLKYGFISVNEMIDIIEASGVSADSYLEELIVRRELAYNFVFYNSGYNNFSMITYAWAYQTMKVHKSDPREYIYTLEDYLQCNTHDKYFNAAMTEMICTNSMHGYMRMYWAKKILEWSESYEDAYQTIIYLNNTYFLDGNTPNGYMNVAWIFGKHDRAWTERPIFGKLRYMNDNGLKRKFNIEEYVKKMEDLYVSKT